MFKEPLKAILEKVGVFLLSQRSVTGIWEGTQLKTSADITANTIICEQLTNIAPVSPLLAKKLHHHM